MECFAHPNQAAVATCKGCGRAICRSCARDLAFAVVCSERCAKDVSQLDEMNRRALRIYGIGVTKLRVPLVPIMWGALALLFAGFGVFQYFHRGQIDWFFLLFGLVMAVLAFISYRRAKDLQLNC